jgi:hypothetical protein
MARVADRVLTIADGELANDETVAAEPIEHVFANQQATTHESLIAEPSVMARKASARL